MRQKIISRSVQTTEQYGTFWVKGFKSKNGSDFFKVKNINYLFLYYIYEINGLSVHQFLHIMRW